MVSARIEELVGRFMALRHERVPSLVLLICALTFVVTCFSILAGGYAPTDDAKRHVAKVVSGKSWDEVLILRSEFTGDAHPGWHAVLNGVRSATGLDSDGLLMFSVALGFLAFTTIPVFLIRRPEGWLVASLLVAAISVPYARVMLGRPFIFTSLNTVLILSAATPLDREEPSRAVSGWLVFTTAFCTWLHPSTWFLYTLPWMAFLVTGRFRAWIRLGVILGVGIAIGLLPTGEPLGLLLRMPRQALASVQQVSLPQDRVTEFQPLRFPVVYLFGTGLLLILKHAFSGNVRKSLARPALVLAAMGAILGQVNGRFWADWGLVGMLVWLTFEAGDWLQRQDRLSVVRIVQACAAAVCFWVTMVHGMGEYWDRDLRRPDWVYATATPAEKEWFPGPGGVVYATSMGVFYQGFYNNPRAPWRYALGFEPAIMREDDLAVYRSFLWNEADVAALQPWLAKMKPEDRLVIEQPGKPPIPDLEWHLAERKLWVGRLPRPGAKDEG